MTYSTVCILLVLLASLLNGPRIIANASQIDVSLSISDDIVSSTTDSFRMIGVDIDFWPSSKLKWKRSGALELDLSNKRLIALAKGLRGSLLRLGGSPADMLLYETYEGACSKENLNKTQKHGKSRVYNLKGRIITVFH